MTTATSNPMINACLAGMNIVRKYQFNPQMPLSTVEKDDKTLLTVADIESQEAIRKAFTIETEAPAFVGEEGERKGFVGEGRYGLIVDPLDGTNVFVSGMITSTVILGWYDRKERKLLECAIGEPISGRLWHATDGQQTILNGTIQKLCRVWDGPLSKGNIFMDISHGFTSHGRQILTDAGNARLYASLNTRCKILMPGSNGLMQALVANGRERMAGSITTAVGFPGDVCGALLVEQAGGALKAYAKKVDGELSETDPGNPLMVDALICANNAETLAVLAEAFEAAVKIG